MDNLNLFNYDKGLNYFGFFFTKISNFSEKFILRKYYYSFNFCSISSNFKKSLNSLLIVSQLIQKKENSINFFSKFVNDCCGNYSFYMKLYDLKILGEEGNFFFLMLINL